MPEPVVQSPRTVYDTFEGLTAATSNQEDITKSKNGTIKRMKCIPQGGNWQDLPDHLKTKSMKVKRNTQDNVYKCLKWDQPSCTIVNPRKCLLTHPEEHRILSVRKCARFYSQYQMILYFVAAANCKRNPCPDGKCRCSTSKRGYFIL